jgi:8-oxo-dGTP pyrophosphatase MutT (NUDIX family)
MELDIVDENDNVIMQATKKHCHKNGLWHRGSAVLVFKDNSFKEVLIQRRSKKFVYCPDKLAYPAGHLDVGETYLEGVKREFHEEMFHEQELPDLEYEELFKLKKTTDNDPVFLTIFRTVYGGPFNIYPKEVEDCYFEHIDKLILHMKEKPEEYTETAILITKEYKKRTLRDNI